MSQPQIIRALDHYFDQADYLRRERLPQEVVLSPVFTDRGDPTGYDYTQLTLTIDGAWHTLDLSALVPEGATAIILRVQAVNTGAIASIYFRKNGNSNAYNVSRVETQTLTTTALADAIVFCDTARRIQYLIANVGTWASITIVVAGWLK